MQGSPGEGKEAGRTSPQLPIQHDVLLILNSIGADLRIDMGNSTCPVAQAVKAEKQGKLAELLVDPKRSTDHLRLA